MIRKSCWCVVIALSTFRGPLVAPPKLVELELGLDVVGQLGRWAMEEERRGCGGRECDEEGREGDVGERRSSPESPVRLERGREGGSGRPSRRGPFVNRKSCLYLVISFHSAGAHPSSFTQFSLHLHRCILSDAKTSDRRCQHRRCRRRYSRG